MNYQLTINYYEIRNLEILTIDLVAKKIESGWLLRIYLEAASDQNFKTKSTEIFKQIFDFWLLSIK